MSARAPPTRPKRATAPRGPARAFGRSLADFGELSPAERTLLECSRRGETARIGAAPPEAETAANCIRAAFLRFVALGGDEQNPVHERGIELVGARITGSLDLEGARIARPLYLWYCALESINAFGAHFSHLALDGSRLAGSLAGDRLTCDGGVFLRSGFHATGTVRLSGARIGGDMTCSGGRFEVGLRDTALTAEGAHISGNLFLSKGFHATGQVRLMGATIDRDLECDDAHFEAEGDALRCERGRVAGAFFFRSMSGITGDIVLGRMHVGSLSDDAASWRLARGNIALDGFTYERISGDAPTDAAGRIEWLDAQWSEHCGADFRPQPWEQLIAVLRDTGHPEEARKVAIAKQDRLRRAGKIVAGARTLHLLYGLLVGYGYRPVRLLAATASIWLLCAAAYWAGTNPQWFGADIHLLAPPPVEQLDAMPGRPARTPDYSNFVPLIYSADVLLPVIDLGYKKEWQPIVADVTGKPLFWGQLLRFLYWFEIAFGWVAGLLLVGVLSNLIKRD